MRKRGWEWASVYSKRKTTYYKGGDELGVEQSPKGVPWNVNFNYYQLSNRNYVSLLHAENHPLGAYPGWAAALAVEYSWWMSLMIANQCNVIYERVSNVSKKASLLDFCCGLFFCTRTHTHTHTLYAKNNTNRRTAQCEYVLVRTVCFLRLSLLCSKFLKESRKAALSWTLLDEVARWIDLIGGTFGTITTRSCAIGVGSKRKSRSPSLVSMSLLLLFASP